MGASSSSTIKIPMEYPPEQKCPKEYSKQDRDFKSLILTGNITQKFEEFYQFLLWIIDVNKRVADIIVQNKDHEYETLADMYFESSYKTLQLCNALVSLSRLAKTNRIIFEYVNNKLKEEDKERIDDTEKLVEELKRLNESISGLFDQDFFKLLISVYTEQAALSKELLKHTKYSKGFEIKRHKVRIHENPTEDSLAILMCSLKIFVGVSMVEKTNEVIHQLETLMDFGESDESLSAAMDRIMEDMDEFTSGIEELSQRAEMCSKAIMAQRTQLRNHLLSE